MKLLVGLLVLTALSVVGGGGGDEHKPKRATSPKLA